MERDVSFSCLQEIIFCKYKCLWECYLWECYLWECHLWQCYLWECYLSECYLWECYLWECHLWECYLWEYYLWQCYLWECYLSECYLLCNLNTIIIMFLHFLFIIPSKSTLVTSKPIFCCEKISVLLKTNNALTIFSEHDGHEIILMFCWPCILV